jgi:hypothetical protein
VRASRNRDYRCQLSPSQRAGGKKPRHPSGSLGEEVAAQGLTSHAAVNEYLEREYLAEHNRRFARAAAEPEDYHRRRPSASALRQIFRLETERRISNDWVVRHEGRLLQLQPKHRHYGPTQVKALVCEWEDGNLEVYYRGERLAYQELAEAPKRSVVDGSKARVTDRSLAKAHKPSLNHPW